MATINKIDLNGDTYDIESSGLVTTQPTNPSEGATYYDTVNDVVKVYDGSNWIALGSGSGNVVGPNSSTNGHLAVFDGATGKAIKDGGAVPTKVSDLTNDSGYITSADLKTVGGENLVGSGDIKAIINTATGTDSLTVFGNPSSVANNINIGATSASSSNGYSVAIGNYARATGTSSIALGRGAGAGGVSSVAIGRDSSAGQENSIAIGRSAIASGTNSIQIGKGSTTATKKLNVGFDTDNYELLDGATGLIPDARISTNIQRTANMVDTLSGADNDHYPTTKAVADAIQSAGGGDMMASVYDPNNVGGDAFNYTNFINTPTIPSKTSDLTNDSGFITSASVPTKVSDLTNDSGFITSSALPTKTSDLTNDSGFITSSYHDSTKQDTLSTQTAYTNKGGATKVPKITTNTLGQVTSITEVTITQPTKTSDLTNDSGFITSSALPTKVSDLTNDSGFITSSSLPTKVSDLTNDSGFITGINSSDVTTALGYTPYNSTNPNGYITSSYHDSTKQDTISDLSTIRTNATAGAGAATTIAGYGNIVTHNASEFLTSETVVSGDSGVTYTIKVSNSDPTSGTPATTITFVL